MILPFAILGALTIAGAIAAVTLRNLVHCVLALTVAFVGLAGLFLQLDAQFVGLAQILVYVGAVAILIVFAVLLTRATEPVSESIFSCSWISGCAISAAVFVVLAWTIHSSAISSYKLPPQPMVTVRQIGESLMSKFALPLEVIGLLLTAALMGAVTITINEDEGTK